jgi:hypothetical protein
VQSTRPPPAKGGVNRGLDVVVANKPSLHSPRRARYRCGTATFVHDDSSVNGGDSEGVEAMLPLLASGIQSKGRRILRFPIGHGVLTRVLR